MKKALIAFIIIALLILGSLVLSKKVSSPLRQTKDQPQEQKMVGEFATPKKSAHYESNTPAHGMALAAVPLNVVIDFNFDLAKPSSIKIEKDGKDFGIEETVIDPNKLSMRRSMDPASSDGIYTVSYNACWPDGSCHDGFFQFAINKKAVESYIDMRGKPEVTISLKEIAFNPKDVRVSRGTKITWMNDDADEHYVNTDSHPAHTYFKDQNSKALKKGDTYSLTFEKAGIYLYHCSAHADSMSGSIVVE